MYFMSRQRHPITVDCCERIAVLLAQTSTVGTALGESHKWGTHVLPALGHLKLTKYKFNAPHRLFIGVITTNWRMGRRDPNR